MSRNKALQDLRDKVASGTCGHGSFLQKWHEDAAYSGGCGVNAHKAYDGSLDAARALHDAVLGVGFNYSIHKDSASVMTWAHTVEGKVFSAANPNPARAWLIAILKALIAQEETT